MLGKLTSEEITAFVSNNHIARLGCNDGHKTYVVPITYAFFDTYFLCYSLDGLKIEMMRENPNVCVEIDEIQNYSNWKCVVAFGKYEEITDEESINDAQKHFSDALLKLKASESSLPPDETIKDEQSPFYKGPVFYRIQIEEISGRFEKQIT